MSDVQSLLNI